MFVRWN